MCALFARPSTSFHGAFIENRGQLQDFRGNPADSVIAYSRFGSGFVYLTSTSLYFSSLDGAAAERIGICLGDTPLDVTFLEPAQSSPFTYVASTTHRAALFSRLKLVHPGSQSQLVISFSGDSLCLRFLGGSASLPWNLRCMEAKRTEGAGYYTWVGTSGTTFMRGWTQLLQTSGVTQSPETAAFRFDDGSAHSNSAATTPTSIPHTYETTLLLKASTFLGGSGIDSVSSTAAVSGGIILCGSTTSAAFPCTPGVSQTSLKGTRDAFVAKYDTKAKPVWTTYFGGDGDDIAYACATGNGKVYVTGQTSSSNISSAGTLQTVFGGGYDAFAASFDESSGTRVACTYVGGSESDEGRAICILANGDVGIAGTTASSGLTLNGHQPQLTGGIDAFALIMDGAMTTRKWGTYYGGRADEEGRGIGSLDDGSIILAGNTSSPNSGLKIAENVGQGSTPPGGLQTSGFIVRFNSTGTRLWGRYLGGESFDTITCLRTLNNAIYAGGFTSSSSGGVNNFISSGSAQQVSGSGIADGFLSKLNPDGTLAWGTFIGGTNNDRVLGINVTTPNDVIICGSTNSSDFPLVESDQKAIAGDHDAFVAYVLKDGSSFGRCMIIGGNNYDAACGASYLADRTVLVAGSTASASFPTSQASQPTHAGAIDAFICLLDVLYTVDVQPVDEHVGALAYPQPFRESFSLSAPFDVVAPSEVAVLDIFGRTVHAEVIRYTANAVPLSLPWLPAGAYNVVWSNSMQRLRYHVIKQ